MRSAEAIRTKRMGAPSKKTGLRVVTGRESKRRKRKVRPKRYLKPVDDAVRRFDPITHSEGMSGRWGVLLYLLGTALLHAGLFYGLSGVESSGERTFTPDRRPEKVTVRITDPRITPPKPVAPPTPDPVVEPPKPETAPVEAPKAMPKEAPKPQTKRSVARRAAPVEADVPVDPVNIPDQAPAPTQPVRRVVGLSFESTVKGGGGPAFAVGNTRMGGTGNRAESRTDVEPIAGQAYRPGAKRPTGNKVSAAVPTAGVTLTKPKRLSTAPPAYPALLKAQGIEGNVAVLIRITPEGWVASVKVVKGSGYPEFDTAARTAAMKERFSPATRNGEAIEYTLKYTYRFRVKEQ